MRVQLTRFRSRHRQSGTVSANIRRQKHRPTCNSSNHALVGHKVPQHREGLEVVRAGSCVVWLPGASVLERSLSFMGCQLNSWRILAVFYLIRERTSEWGTDAYFPLGRDALAKIVGLEDCRHVLGWLEKADFIEGNDESIIDKRCEGYRLTTYAASLPLERVELPAELSEKVKWSSRSRLDYTLRRHPAHRLLWESLHRVSLHPDSVLIQPAIDPDSESQARRIDHWRNSICRIHKQDWHFSCDRKAQRIHNNITSLPSKLRRYVLLDGKPCAEIDIACSQPLLLHRFYPKGSPEAPRYGKLVMSGSFYESIADAAGHKWIDRGILKKDVFTQVLYGQVREVYPMWRGFYGLFPELAAIIRRVKAVRYSALAISNQKTEADIVIRTVIPRLAVELPGVPVLTVHDSLLIPEQYAQHASNVLAEEIENAIGLRPKITSKHSAVGQNEVVVA